MNDTTRRLLGYGGAGVLVAALVWGGFVRKPDASPGTLLESARLHLQLAGGMPAKDRQGRPLAARVQLLDQGEDFLARFERSEPGAADGHLLRGYLNHLRGDHAAAAASYARARAAADVPPEAVPGIVLDEARALRLGGNPAACLDVLAGQWAQLEARNAQESRFEKALALEALGRRPEALASARDAAQCAEDPMRAIHCGQLLERLGDGDAAGAAYRRALPAKGVAHYFLARLKAKAGNFDSALQELELAVQADGSQTRRLLAEEAELWRPVADTDSFRTWVPSAAPAADPGR